MWLLGISLFARDCPHSFRVHIDPETYGWISPYEKGVPEKWPVDFGFMQAHETVVEPRTGFVMRVVAADR